MIMSNRKKNLKKQSQMTWTYYLKANSNNKNGKWRDISILLKIRKANINKLRVTDSNKLDVD